MKYPSTINCLLLIHGRETQTSLSSSWKHQGELRDIISPPCPWSALGCPPGWTSLKHITGIEGSSYLGAQTTSAGSTQCGGATGSPSSSKTCKGETSLPAEESHFSSLYIYCISHSFRCFYKE